MSAQNPIANQQAQHVKAGTKLISEHDMSQKMYVILSGKARVYKMYLGQRISLAVLGGGEIFGEMSFIDAQPRSASVEALTDMDVIVIDGAKGQDHLKSLPPWVWSILRTVFYRFRTLDRDILALQSAVSYRNKGLKFDIVASTIYLEIVRFIKALRLLYSQRREAAAPGDSPSLFDEVSVVLGNKSIGLRVFWNLLQEHEFLSADGGIKSAAVSLNEERLEQFDNYLRSEIEKERYLMLSHGSLSVIRRMLGVLSNQHTEGTKVLAMVSHADLNAHTIPNHEQALKEMESHRFAEPVDGGFRVDPTFLHQQFIYHSILKSFDHSAVNVD